MRKARPSRSPPLPTRPSKVTASLHCSVGLRSTLQQEPSLARPCRSASTTSPWWLKLTMLLQESQNRSPRCSLSMHKTIPQLSILRSTLPRLSWVICTLSLSISVPSRTLRQIPSITKLTWRMVILYLHGPILCHFREPLGSRETMSVSWSFKSEHLIRQISLPQPPLLLG